jgi:signal transduction histidine kinase
MIKSLRFRLAVGGVVAIGAALLLVWWSLSRVFTDYVLGQYRDEMSVLSDSLAAAVQARDGRLALNSVPSDPRLNLPAGGRYWELEENNVVLERSRSLWDTVIAEARLSPSAYPGFRTGAGPDGQPILVMTQESTLGEGKNARRFWIYTAFPKTELDVALTGFHGQLRLMLLITAGLLAAGAFAQAAAGLAPLSRLRRKVADIRAGNLAELGEEGPSEVLPLVKEIDLLLKERETAVERARSRASDLAHGLKTPLTVLSQLAASMDPKSADMALKQVDIIRQRADRQLQAARLGVERMATADVGEMTTKLIQVLRPLADRRALNWRVSMSGDLKVAIDPADLAEAIGNVLDNATKWATRSIEVTARRDGNRVLLAVADDGPGVDAEHYDHILRRGNHAQDDAGGSGLGLAITHDIAEAYGATITPGRSELGGLKLTLDLPVNPPSRPDRARHS